nr:hypothetical protein [Tanacetum cinerariifolium]
MAIKEATDLVTLPLDELVRNLKVYEMILENDGVVSKTTKKDKVIGLDAAIDLVMLPIGLEEDVKMASGTKTVCLKCDLLPDDWIVDSGCTKNMIMNKRLLTLYKAYDDGHIIFRSNLKGKVISGGNITHDSITITNVKHVSGLACNLISVCQLSDDDYVVSITRVDCTISIKGKTIAKGHRKNGLYTCKLGDNSKQKFCLAYMVDDSTLWPKRLGHANMRLVQNLACNELVKNLPNLSFERHFCDTHGLGSQGNANNRTQNEVLTSRVLDLLHLDLFGSS